MNVKCSKLRAALALVAVLAGTGLTQLSLGQASGLEKRVDLFLKDADLLYATQALTRQTGIQFIIQPTSEPFAKINLSLNNVTAEEAIRYLCQAAGAWAERDENGVYIIRRGPKPDPAPTENPRVAPVAKPKIMARIKVMKADPKLVFDMLVNRVTFDPAEGLREMNMFSDLARGNLGKVGSGAVTVVGQNSGTTSFPFSSFSQKPKMEPSGTSPNSESGNNVIIPGEEAGQSSFGGGGQGQPGNPPGGGFQQGQGNQSQLTPGQGLVPDGIDYIVYDPTTNDIVVRGDDDAVRLLRSRIALFDQAPEQVEIKVQFITTSQSVSRALGFDWLYQRGSIFAGNRPGSFARNGDPIFLNFATGNIQTRLRALLQTGQGRVVNSPLIRTLNNQLAIVQQTVETTIFVNQVVNGPGGVTIVPQPLQFAVNTQLVVRPRINGDRTITMNLAPQIQDFGQVRRGPDGQEIPDRLSQLINVVARVRDGDTIVLAGLTRKSDTSSESRFPILGDLPIIGQFFRASNRDLNNSELLIFVTPRIITDEVTESGGP